MRTASARLFALRRNPVTRGAARRVSALRRKAWKIKT